MKSSIGLHWIDRIVSFLFFVFCAILAWGLAELFMEDSREIALIGKACIDGDLHNSRIGFSQEFGGVIESDTVE